MSIYSKLKSLTLWLYVSGIAVGLFGMVIGFYGFDSAGDRFLGVSMCLIGAYLIRKAKFRSYVQSHGEIDSKSNGESHNSNGRKNVHFGPVVWVSALISFVSCAVFLILMFVDAKEGYHHAWLIYSFAVSGQVFLLVIIYIVGVVVRNIFRG